MHRQNTFLSVIVQSHSILYHKKVCASNGVEPVAGRNMVCSDMPEEKKKKVEKDPKTLKQGEVVI